MKKKKYQNIWLVFVNIKAIKGLKFNDLVEEDPDNTTKYKAAWGHVLVKALTIDEAIRIVPLGLKELGFEVIMIDKAENFKSLVEYKEAKKERIKEADWLIDSEFVFMI